MEKRAAVQSALSKKLEKERNGLLTEKKEKYNEFQLMYNAEVTDLREEYEVAVENAKAQLGPEIERNSKETETLRSENEDLVSFLLPQSLNLC